MYHPGSCRPTDRTSLAPPPKVHPGCILGTATAQRVPGLVLERHTSMSERVLERNLIPRRLRRHLRLNPERVYRPRPQQWIRPTPRQSCGRTGLLFDRRCSLDDSLRYRSPSGRWCHQSGVASVAKSLSHGIVERAKSIPLHQHSYNRHCGNHPSSVPSSWNQPKLSADSMTSSAAGVWSSSSCYQPSHESRVSCLGHLERPLLPEYCLPSSLPIRLIRNHERRMPCRIQDERPFSQCGRCGLPMFPLGQVPGH